LYESPVKDHVWLLILLQMAEKRSYQGLAKEETGAIRA
jgi:hypothetical protein